MCVCVSDIKAINNNNNYVCVCVCVCMCVCIYICKYSYCLLGDVFMVEYYTSRFCLLKCTLYVNVVFVMSSLYSAVSLTQLREHHL